jgi:flagellar biosynthetic protein FliR
MPADAALGTAWMNTLEPALGGFLAVLARPTGAFAFVPIPGLRSASLAPKALLALSLALVLAPSWPRVPVQELSPWLLLVEACAGLGAGLLVAWLNEALSLAMQVVGLQAGYTYASTVDPTTQADSAVLQILAQLGGSLLFFQAGLDHQLLRAFATSITAPRLPDDRLFGQMLDGYWEMLVQWSGAMFELALRLALPVVGLLLIVDLALALLGRLENHLQLLTLAFPLKMLAAMCLLAMLTVSMTSLYGEAARKMLVPLQGWMTAVGSAAAENP